MYGLSEYLIALQEAEKARQESKARKTPRKAFPDRKNDSSATGGYTDQLTRRR